MNFFVKGNPVPYSTKLEKQWKDSLRKQIPINNDSTSKEQGVILKFYLESFTHNGNPFDLDNLVEPVFSVLIGEKGYFKGKRNNIKWWHAYKILSQSEGVEIEISRNDNIDSNNKISQIKKFASNNFIHIKIKLGQKILMDETYTGTMPTSAKSIELPEWLKSKGINPLGRDDKVSVYLGFPENVNIGDIATGKVKSVIDCLYPILGGTSFAPEDWKIEELFIWKLLK